MKIHEGIILDSAGVTFYYKVLVFLSLVFLLEHILPDDTVQMVQRCSNINQAKFSCKKLLKTKKL